MSEKAKKHLRETAGQWDAYANQELKNWHKLREQATRKLDEVNMYRRAAQAYRDDIKALERAGR